MFIRSSQPPYQEDGESEMIYNLPINVHHIEAIEPQHDEDITFHMASGSTIYWKYNQSEAGDKLKRNDVNSIWDGRY